MNLRSYCDSLPRGGMAALAAAAKCSPIYLSQLAAGQNGRVPSPELCVLLERASGGAVTRKEMRPGDWAQIWPEAAQADWRPVGAAEPATATAGEG